MSKQKYPQTSVGTVGGTTVSRARKVNGYSNYTIHAKRDRKRKEAEGRQAEYDKLTTKQKLEQLGSTGSNRQRARLEKRLLEEQSVKVPQKAERLDIPTAPKAEKKGKSKKAKVEMPRVAIP